jgi:LAO/AO transport system kinase
MSREPRLPAAARAIVAGDRRALARTITSIENGESSASPVLRALYRRTRQVPIVGFAGPLGVGKSSLINLLVAHLRSLGRTVAVIAVDPSSPFSGGSVLGDRIRFETRSGDMGVFFRSMASRGAAGGVAGATLEAARLLDAAGFDLVLVETVGSGQVDVAIREIASTRVVVLVPHLGDEVQTLKAGLFEIADVFCVNKTDLPGADTARRDLAELVTLAPDGGRWRPRIVGTSTMAPSGIPDLWAAIEAHETFLDTSGTRREGERHRLATEIVGLVRDEVGRQLTEELESDPGLRRLLDRVVARELDPRSAADRLRGAVRRGR